MCTFSSNLNLLMEGWKYGSRELLKATFCHPKKESFKKLGFFVTKKAIGKQTGSAQNFLHPPTQVPRGAYIPYFKSMPHFLLLNLFRRMSLSQVRISKTVNKHTVDYQPIPSELTSRICMSLQNISWIFLQTCISQNGFRNISISQC